MLPPNSANCYNRKLWERFIADRLSLWLVEVLTLSPWQTAFCKGRSTTDQCLLLSQFIPDGFLSTQRRHTDATFFDFSRTYNRVWRTGFMRMSKMGVHHHFPEWLSSCIINCTARVLVNSSTGPSMTFRDGHMVLLYGCNMCVI